jgi:hypothetical protein
MDIQLEKIKIIHRLIEVDEEWIIRSIQRLLEIDEVNMEAAAQRISKDELLQRAAKAEEDIRLGRVEDLETYLLSIKD